jgi:hypothetical protein
MLNFAESLALSLPQLATLTATAGNNDLMLEKSTNPVVQAAVAAFRQKIDLLQIDLDSKSLLT